MESDGLGRLFAPWRMGWVSGKRDGGDHDCVFCAYSEPGEHDRENRVVARNQNAFTLLNRAPYSRGHVMVIPSRHGGDYADLDETTLGSHTRLIRTTVRALEVAVSPDGFNVGMNLGKAGGASISDHLHTHVVPRWSQETDHTRWFENTDDLVQALDRDYDHLHEAFASLEGARKTGGDEAIVVDG